MNVSLSQKLPHFGPYKKERQEQISQNYRKNQNGIKNDVGVNNTASSNGGFTEGEVPKVKDVIGKALPRIGAFNDLDLKKHVVALIDDVSMTVICWLDFFFFPISG